MKTIKQLGEIAEQVAQGKPMPKLNPFERDIVSQTVAKILESQKKANDEVAKLKQLGTSIFD